MDDNCSWDHYVFCPVCESKFREFEPFGLMKRDNARCPGCGSLERHRLLWKYLNDKTTFFNKDIKIRLLHFAPEKCFYDRFSVNKNIDYVPCDIYPQAYAYQGVKEIIKVDITHLPFEQNNFDVILCIHVLEHIPDDWKALSELYRVMKEKGWGIFQAPLDDKRKVTYEDFTITKPKDREKAFGQHNHVRKYGQDYKDRLKNAGFTVTADDYIKSFSNEELFRYGLQPDEIIYFCRK